MKSKLTVIGSVVLLLAFVALETGCKKDPLKSKPVACLGTLPDTLISGEDFTFIGTCSEGAINYLWQFGDGDVANTAVAVHNYTSKGTYTVTLTVTNGEGQTSLSKTVIVKSLSCDPGYEGTDCNTETRAKFLGEYTGPESCTIGTDNYKIKVLSNIGIVTNVYLMDLFAPGTSVTAVVDGTTLTIPS